MSSKGFRKTIKSWISPSSYGDSPSSRSSIANLPTPPTSPPQRTYQRADSEMSDVARPPSAQASPMPAPVVNEPPSMPTPVVNQPSYTSVPAVNQLPSSSFRDSLNIPRSGHSRSRTPSFVLPIPENETYALSSLSTQCALTLSEVTKEIAPIPAIGQLVDCLKHVFQAVERSKVNKDQWKLLRGRCVMVLRIAGAHVENYGKEHYPSLDDAAALLQDTLNRVEERARHYTEMNEFLALVLFQSISDEIRTLFADLDACLRLFNFTVEVAQEQWMGEYQAVQRRESSELQRLRGELEKMNIHFDAFGKNQEELLTKTDKMVDALQQVLDAKSLILQDQTTTTVASYVDAQQLVRTILSVTGLRLPPKLLLGKQCILDAPIPIKTGITCDIYQASFLGGEKVAKKVFRIGMSDKDYVEKYATRFLRIASLWSDFRSDYTLPFYGIGMESFEGDNHFQLYMVSPLMKNFDAMTFLKQYRGHQGMKKNILRIITDAAKGLQYLHNRNPPVVHSGMRGDNILITDSEGAILGGFGLTKALESVGNNKIPPAVMTGKTESQRWMAPEMFVDDPPLETPCDVWGWAMAALEIVSGSIPYHTHKQAMTIILQIGRGPPRREHHPKFEEYAYRPNEMWELLQKCWAMEPGDRPTIDEVVGRLKQIARMPEA
ncbi:Serine/threonine-protein kinase TNNI3K [Rhizoctonia solani]|uniref:Serine/threonine-protein kinase TNNI3K n=1 Tax=Rhizoctonia solani TaxID=456999 RepID=A0A0K6FSQ7_9AGAM|nr:Serine/threonine-protein kinase TNNI3K [Rhizoctonia solani]